MRRSLQNSPATNKPNEKSIADHLSNTLLEPRPGRPDELEQKIAQSVGEYICVEINAKPQPRKNVA
jgi:hypothetical protein